jgi:hypothetical protein
MLEPNLLAMRDACFADILQLIRNCARHAAERPNLTGQAALEILYDSIEQQGPEGFGLTVIPPDLPICPSAETVS